MIHDETLIFTLEGTGKNAGTFTTGKATRSNIYTVTLQVAIPGKKKEKTKELDFFRSTKQTAAASKGQTSWRVADIDHARFAALKSYVQKGA